MYSKGISFTTRGDFKNTEKALKAALRFDIRDILEAYGEAGVVLLGDATPKDTGKTSESWYYRVKHEKNGWSVTWYNSNVVNKYSKTKEPVNVALMLEYGHGTRQGGYVKGIDYINPTMKPVFDYIAKDAWERMRSYYVDN